MSFKFEWDNSKSHNNLIKHRVTFEEATSVFFDNYARIFDDDEHSIGKRRELIFGYSNNNRLLFVSYTQRTEIIRIISARKVTRN